MYRYSVQIWRKKAGKKWKTVKKDKKGGRRTEDDRNGGRAEKN